MLFSDRSIWTMVHGIVLGGGAAMALSAATFCLYATRPSPDSGAPTADVSRSLMALLVLSAAVLWLTVIAGTYVIFPPYRVAPPPGVTDLSDYPRALILANPDTAWLHAFAMESKEHMPWIAAMLATAVAFVGVRYRTRLGADGPLRQMVTALLAICLALVSFAALMGVFVNKVAPLQ
jgi:hypothetical protein